MKKKFVPNVAQRQGATHSKFHGIVGETKITVVIGLLFQLSRQRMLWTNRLVNLIMCFVLHLSGFRQISVAKRDIDIHILRCQSAQKNLIELFFS
jgi:hypothetical protein